MKRKPQAPPASFQQAAGFVVIFRLYLEGVSKDVASRYGDVVSDPTDADVALLVGARVEIYRDEVAHDPG